MFLCKQSFFHVFAVRFPLSAAHDQDELQKAAEEQRRHEEKERLFKLEEAGKFAKSRSKHEARACFPCAIPADNYLFNSSLAEY